MLGGQNEVVSISKRKDKRRDSSPKYIYLIRSVYNSYISTLILHI